MTEAPTETEPPAPTETELPAEPEAPAIAETEIPAETTRIAETAAEPDEEPAAAEPEEAEPETGASSEAFNYDGITRLLEQYLRDKAETGASQGTK